MTALSFFRGMTSMPCGARAGFMRMSECTRGPHCRWLLDAIVPKPKTAQHPIEQYEYCPARPLSFRRHGGPRPHIMRLRKACSAKDTPWADGCRPPIRHVESDRCHGHAPGGRGGVPKGCPQVWPNEVSSFTRSLRRTRSRALRRLCLMKRDPMRAWSKGETFTRFVALL